MENSALHQRDKLEVGGARIAGGVTDGSAKLSISQLRMVIEAI